jgi:hypothetical protein
MNCRSACAVFTWSTSDLSELYIWHSVANKLYSLNCWCYSLVYKILFPIYDFHFLCCRKYYNPLFLTVSRLSHQTSCTPTKSNFYLTNSLATAISEPALYRLLAFHVPKRLSLFLCLQPDTSSRNTSPPGDPSVGVFDLRTVLSPEEASRIYECFLTRWFLQRSC